MDLLIIELRTVYSTGVNWFDLISVHFSHDILSLTIILPEDDMNIVQLME